MKENKLADISMDFSVQIINLVKYLKSKHESVISNQIGRIGKYVHWYVHYITHNGEKNNETKESLRGVGKISIDVVAKTATAILTNIVSSTLS